MSILSFFKKFFTKRRLIILVVIIVAILGIFAYTQRSKQKPLAYESVKKQDIYSTISASGKLSGKQTANLKFQSSGKLGYLNVKAGQIVIAGQVIAGLDARQLSISLQEAQNSLKDKQATVNKILDDIHLFQYGNGGTTGETETQKAVRTQAEVARDNAYDNVNAAGKALQDSTIVSPIAGLVTKADLIPGQNISFSDLVAQVVDTSEVTFETEVDEADISKVKLGQNAKVTLNSYPNQTFAGTVSEIESSTKTATSGATVIIVKIKLENPGINFISDLNGQADLIVDSVKQVLTIPQDALVDDKFVYLQKGSTPVKTAITTGISSDTDIEVKSGLTESDKIVTNPADVPSK